MAVSKTVILQCKNAKIDFDVLVLCTMLFARMLEGQPQLMNPVDAVTLFHHSEISLMTDLRHSGSSMELPGLLAATHRAGATDIRDKVYSLYGITSTDMSSLGLRADYTLSAREALVNTTYALLKQGQSLDLLEVAEGRPAGDTSLPSWVPASSGPAMHGQTFLGHSKESQAPLLDIAVPACLPGEFGQVGGRPRRVSTESLRGVQRDQC